MQRCILLAVAVFGVCLGVEAAGARTRRDASIEKLLDAIAMVESRANPDAVGDGGRAIGAYQIHKRYWIDGTRILGVKWHYREAKDPVKARKVVRAYLSHYGRNKSILQKARIHNGGPRGYRKKATLPYARKIARVLQKDGGASS